MLCLRCGECCRTMSPLMEDPEHEPCWFLRMAGDVATCEIYHETRRPKQCVAHDFPASVCPIGRDVLNIHDADSLAAREYALGYAPWVDGKELSDA
jgi:hypothetical protein